MALSASGAGVSLGAGLVYRTSVGTDGVYDSPVSNLTPTDPHFANVSLLLHLDGSNGSTTFTDSSGSPKTPAGSGSAKISTAQSKFGGASLELDGNGDYLTVSGFASWNIRTTPFTVECFARRVPAGNQYFLCGAASAAELTTSNAQDFYFGSIGGTLYVGDGATNNIAAASLVSDSTFQHVELSFDGTTYRVFFDGVSIASSTTLLKSSSIAAIQIGGRSQESHYHQGWLDEFRITVGEARHTANFTPPDAPFPDQ